MNQQPSSSSSQPPFAAFLATFILELFPFTPTMSRSARLRTVSSGQCSLSCLHWLLCRQVGSGSLHSSFHDTVLPYSPRNICDTSSRRKALVVGDHATAIVVLPASVDIFNLLVIPLHGSCRYQALGTAVIVF